MHKSRISMKVILVFLLSLAILVPLNIAESPKAGVLPTSSLSSKLQAILMDDKLDGAVTGVSIRKGDTGEILYSSFGQTRLHPASNMKLLTAAAALEKLGPEYQFSTEAWTDGTVKGNILYGNLFLKGKGDPTLMKADFDQFAKELKAKGIDKINGNLVGDDSWYDDVRLSQDLNWSDESNHTGAQVSALTLSPDKDYDSGTVLIEVSPASKVGEHTQIKLTPATDYVKIVNKTKTVGSDKPKHISVGREHGTNQIIVEGTMPIKGKSSKSWVAVWEPAGYALNVFKRSLQESGVKIGTNSKLEIGVTPEKATLLAFKKSMPLKELLIPFMKLSNNGHGEILTKEMGKVVYGEGSWEKGLQVILETAAGFGVNADTILLRDGSGMSHKNMIPANELSQLLYAIQSKDWFPEYEQSLPEAGVSDRLAGGTLHSRLTEEPLKGKVKAKTGSITGVSTLSGYVTTKSGEKLIFSIMINNYLGPPVTSIEDAIVKTLTDYKF